MSERNTFICEVSKQILGDAVSGALAGRQSVDPKSVAELAIKAAAALYDQLTDGGHFGS